MKLRSSKRVAGWAICGGLLISAGQVLAQTAPTFPTTGWVPLTKQGVPLGDPADDELPISTFGIDVVGDNGSNSAAFVASDATFLYFRLRVGGDPSNSFNHHFLSYAWTCLLDTDSDPTTYELLAAVDGIGGSVDLFRNTTPDKPDSIDGTADTPLATYAVGTYAERPFIASPKLGSGGADYFVDWAVAWSDMAVANFGQNAAFRLVCGTSTLQHQLTAGDILEGGTVTGSFSMTASDAVLCADTGCQYDTIFKDAFE